MKPPRRGISYFIATIEDVLQATEDSFESGIQAIRAVRSAVRQVEDWTIDGSGTMASNSTPEPSGEDSETDPIIRLLSEWIDKIEYRPKGR